VVAAWGRQILLEKPSFAGQVVAHFGRAMAVCYGFEFTVLFENGLTTSAFHQFSCARN
jgi:hypothetical protein